MAFDRSKYQAAPLSTVQGAVKETKKYNTFFGGEKTDYAPFYRMEDDGTVLKRVLPTHEPGNSPYVPMKTAQLEVEVDKKDEKGNVTGKEVKRKKIFIATLHGGAKYDIIEEYIKRVYEKAEQLQDAEDKKKFLNPVTGYRMGGKNGKWVWGIRPQLEYVFYALIDGKIYRDSLTQKQMEALNKESARVCEKDNMAAIDIFSDPTEGYPIEWTRDKDSNGKRVETLQAAAPSRKESWEEFLSKHAVPDKVLEELETYPSLQKLYVNSYSKKDFDMALEGLKHFDEANNYAIFADEEYLDIVEEMSNWVESIDNKGIEKDDDKLPFDEDEKPVAKKAVIKKSAVPAPKKKELSDKEKLAVVNEEFVRQYGDGYDALELEGEELEEAYQLAVKHEDLGYDIPRVDIECDDDDAAPEAADEPEEPETEEDNEPEEEPVKAAPAPKPTKGVEVPVGANSASGMRAVDKIRALREKRMQQKG